MQRSWIMYSNQHQAKLPILPRVAPFFTSNLPNSSRCSCSFAFNNSIPYTLPSGDKSMHNSSLTLMVSTSPCFFANLIGNIMSRIISKSHSAPPSFAQWRVDENELFFSSWSNLSTSLARKLLRLSGHKPYHLIRHLRVIG